MDIWDTIKGLLQWIVIPLSGTLLYFAKKYVTRVEEVEVELEQIKIRQAVVESKIDDIRQDIRDIKFGIDKLIDRKNG